MRLSPRDRTAVISTRRHRCEFQGTSTGPHGCAWGWQLLVVPTFAFANADVEKNIADSKNWAMQAGDMYNQRYSHLKQINTGNVGKMQVAWTSPPGAARPQGSPLVIDGKMYLHSPFPNKVFAIDLDTQKIIWKYEPKQDPAVIPQMCCDTGQSRPGLRRRQGHPAAGRQHAGGARRQERQGAVEHQERRSEAGRREHQRAAHLQGQGHHRHQRRRVGVRGFIAAYNLSDGKQAWRGYSVGPDAEMLIDPDKTMTWTDGAMKPVGKDSSLKTWKGDQWKLGGAPRGLGTATTRR